MRAFPVKIPRRRGFTVLELMLVVAVILILLAIILPSMGYAKKQAQKAGAKAQLSSLQQALAAYYRDFNMYPPSSPRSPETGLLVYSVIKDGRGAEMLAEGLMGYLVGDFDGAGTFTGANASFSDPSNYGFRISKNVSMGGKIYGPYASEDPKQFKVLNASQQYFIDPWGKEILYYRALPQPASVKITTIFAKMSGNNAPAATAFAENDCEYQPDYSGNPDPTKTPYNKAFFQSLGSTAGTNTATGTVLGSDSYLLISAGPDGIYFNADDIVMSAK